MCFEVFVQCFDGQVVKVNLHGDVSFHTSKQKATTKTGKKICRAVSLVASRATPLTFVLISFSPSFSRSFSTFTGSGFRLFALEVVCAPGRAEEVAGCTPAVGVTELEEKFVECGLALLRVGGGMFSCADMARRGSSLREQ